MSVKNTLEVLAVTSAAATLSLLMIPSCRSVPTQEQQGAEEYFQSLQDSSYVVNLTEIRKNNLLQSSVTQLSGGDSTNIVLQWENEDLTHLTLDREHGALLYDSIPVLLWDAQKQHVLGMTTESDENLRNAIPLSYSARGWPR